MSKRRELPRKVGRLRAAALALALALGFRAAPALPQAAPSPAPSPAADARPVQEVVALARSYCGACHAVPPPDSLPKRSWPAVIRTMVGIAQTRHGRAGLSERQMNDLIALYYGSAPESLPRLARVDALPSSRAFIAREPSTSSLPFVAHVEAASLGAAGAAQGLLVSDGEAAEVRLLAREHDTWRETRIGGVTVPVHTQVVDLDADRDADVLVADLGLLPPVDATVGKLLALRQASPGVFTREVLLEGLGRVSDARAVDLDADGDLDIAVAVFGGGDLGELFWLEDTGAAANRYRRRELLKLAGTIAVQPADLNADGRTDLVALLAQEHEMVVGFVSQGGGAFQQHVLARAPHPMWGSTSLTTADLDRDGDTDVVFTNGDAFDAQTDPKPYHGVQWLENRGQVQFAYHDIGRMYGASTAAVGDLDGDGDLDVVAGSWVSYWLEPGRPAVVWYENDGRQNFTAHGVATRPAGVASLALLDVTGDGALDIVAGAIRMDLLMAKFGSPYKAGELFPRADAAAKLPRIVVLENPGKPR